MSGFEIASIVLGVLPLFISAGKVCQNSNSFTALRMVISDTLWNQNNTQWRDSVRLFYQGFWWETAYLQIQLNTVVDNLPDISPDKKIKIKENRDLNAWGQDRDLANALKNLFCGHHDMFQNIMSEAMKLLARLVTYENDSIPVEDMDLNTPLRRLQHFQEPGQHSQDSFLSRFRFLRAENERKSCLENLKTWNYRLKFILDDALANRGQSNLNSPPEVATAPKLLAVSEARELSRRLFRSIHNKWPGCGCNPQVHEARFSLACCRNDECTATTVEFHFLISRLRRGLDITQWREATVIVPKDVSVIPNEYEDRQAVSQICQVISLKDGRDQCLILVVEDPCDPQYDPSRVHVWKAHWDWLELESMDLDGAVSLFDLLDSGLQPSLRTRRNLALILANSVLQLHESPWLGKQWHSNNIYFLRDGKGDLDWNRPYMRASFDDYPHGIETSIMDGVHHRSPGILSLGILLIELHTWRHLSIPSAAIGASLGRVNSAREELKRMATSPPIPCQYYVEATRTCICTKPLTKNLKGSRMSLENPAVQEGVYTHIISQLEKAKIIK